jgi:hypothetical protein
MNLSAAVSRTYGTAWCCSVLSAELYYTFVTVAEDVHEYFLFLNIVAAISYFTQMVSILVAARVNVARLHSRRRIYEQCYYPRARCITLVAMLLASVVTMLPIIMVNPDLSSLEVILFAFQIMATLGNLFFVLVDASAAYALVESIIHSTVAGRPVTLMRVLSVRDEVEEIVHSGSMATSTLIAAALLMC